MAKTPTQVFFAENIVKLLRTTFYRVPHVAASMFFLVSEFTSVKILLICSYLFYQF